MLAAGVLQIPRNFDLSLPSPQAVRMLTERIVEGEELLEVEYRGAESVPPYRRRVERWQGENQAIVDGLLRDLGPKSESPVATDAPFRNTADEFEAIKDEVSREVSQLSQMVIRISIPLSTAESSGPTQSEEKAGPKIPTSLVEPLGEQPARVDEGEPSETVSEATLASLVEDETSVLASVTTEPEATPAPEIEDLAPIALASEASAALPVYDADAVAERDLVGVDRVVDAFAYLIAARTMQPPLAVGLFGNWGSGKTFLMRAIQRRVDQITRGARESGRDQGKIGVYKRVVQIEFNAWHYVEGNLWASLVDHIFSNLRTSFEEGGSELEKRRQTITRHLASTREEQRVISERIRQLETTREDKKSKVAELENEQRTRLERVQKLRIRDVAAVVKLDDTDAIAVSDALARVGAPAEHKLAADATRTLGDARELLIGGSALLTPMRRHGWRGWLWAALLAGILLVAPLTSLALGVLNVSVSTQVFSSIAAVLGFVAFAARAGVNITGSALTTIEAAEARVRKRVDDASAEQAKEIAALQAELGVLERHLANTIRERDATHSEIRLLEEKLSSLTPGKLLAEFLNERSSSEDYRKYLGLTALIRKDFEELSRLVALNNESLVDSRSSANGGGATDFNRVVLYVDDLDRCPPQRVVEVLQAVHLLMSFPVFVVVVAVAPRWLAQSLAAEYRRLLIGRAASSQDGHATPNDYLEKIFQIPFSVAPLDIAARTRFVEGLLELEVAGPGESPHADTTNGRLSKDEVTSAAPDDGQIELAPAPEIPAPPAGDLAPATGTEPADASVPSPPPRAETSRVSAGAVDLNPSSLRFTDAEARFLAELLPVLDASPRSIKRYINIYRLIKSIAGIDSDPAAFRSAMLLLAAQTGIPSVGPQLIRAVADHPEDEAASLADVLEGFDGQAPDMIRFRAWLEEHPDVAKLPVSALARHARHVQLYAFG